MYNVQQHNKKRKKNKKKISCIENNESFQTFNLERLSRCQGEQKQCTTLFHLL